LIKWGRENAQTPVQHKQEKDKINQIINKDKMSNQPKKVFESFRESMLSKTEIWMSLISDEVSLNGPLAQVKGKEKFIEINKPFFDSVRGSKV